jgi:hypothetical protein
MRAVDVAAYDALQEIRRPAQKEPLAETRLDPITKVLGMCPGIGRSVPRRP